MRRDATGHYEITCTAGEAVRAFVPAPLPPQPPVVLEGPLQTLHEKALLACGRLDGVSSLLPDPELFLYAYVRREALLSSQIEGTQSSLSDLLLFELEEAPGVPFDDVVEVSSYVAWPDQACGRIPAVLTPAAGNPCPAAGQRSRRRSAAWGVPAQSELDRRHPAGQRQLRASSTWAGGGLHSRVGEVHSRRTPG